MKSWDLNFFHINDFLKLVECKNFSAAADELYITQSALSKHIQALEKTLGIQLFIRNNKTTRLSTGGQFFLPYAKKFNDCFLQMNKELCQFIDQEQMDFNLGCLITMEFYGIVEAVAAFRTQFPNFTIKMNEFKYNEDKLLSNSLSSGEFDLVFCDSLFLKTKRFEKIAFTMDHLVAVVNRSCPLAEQKQIDLQQLRTEPLCFLSNRTTTYSYCVRLCEEAGFTPNVYFQGTRIGNVFEFVQNKMGIALLMKKFTSHITSEDLVVRDIIPTAERTICLTRLRNSFHNAASEAFWEYIDSYSKSE
ncbi:LysR family transcriptional regulator [Sediminispirochaeta smaragdinae]|uniref:Transcriptional regulator, LysR family n=1 Tax=Sediminispirochaeta smaragdinae (strain DSM 11293 / JCM 15392 / SEBR 4228) TaxID=573413 RepID=E1R4U8_SEDSS|nr:LysR family transcriptional regulator [Sediminispirochaeta smaragdinae]ADK82186.1 transcriptional regulator, LysR family [Sediminispirochaeta smaragdinae DSM 11293]